MSVRLFVPAALLCGLLAHPVAAGPQPSAAQLKLVPVTYQVTDLLIPTTDAGPAEKQVEQLIKLITGTIQPRSWSDVGGRGTIDYYPLTTALIVSQTPEVQQQVADLLAALRRQQDAQVVMEVRLLSVPVATFGRLVREYNLNPSLTVLDDAQMAKLLEAVQSDRSACVMQAPQVTTMNGRSARFAIMDNQAYVTDVTLDNRDGQDLYHPKVEKITTGLQLVMRPTITSDRRAVLVALKMDQSGLDSPVVPLFPIVMPIRQPAGAEPVVYTQYIQQPTLTTHALRRTLTIPDGQTAVLGGWAQVRDEAHETGTPVLSDIPYLKELFTVVRHTTEVDQVLVAVTPRILVAQEPEERKTPARPCPQAKAAVCTTPAPLPCLPCQAEARQANVEALMRQFNALYKQGKYEEAERCALRAHELAPDNGEVTKAIMVARMQGAAAVIRCGATEKSCPKPQVAELLAKYHDACRGGRLTEATQFAVQALALDPACFSKR